MFNKRSEESEWTRFSKALPGREGNKEEQPTADEVHGLDQNGTAAEAAAEVATVSPSVASPSARPLAADTNFSLARPGIGTPSGRVSDASDEVESTIGEHATFNGTYRSEHSIRVRGAAQGEIECSRAVFIEENAKVEAKVTAATITVAGEVNGELTCSGRVEIQPSGRVTGTINAATLVMQEGAYFDGNLRMKQSGSEATVST
jgi:cytoskeletal protein CcmA (bactofilin family)